MIVYGAIALERKRDLSIPRWIVFWGDASYSTYLTHMYVLWFVAAAGRWAAPNFSWQAWTATLIGLLTCASSSAACHLCIERPLNRIVRRVFTPIAGVVRQTTQAT